MIIIRVFETSAIFSISIPSKMLSKQIIQLVDDDDLIETKLTMTIRCRHLTLASSTIHIIIGAKWANCHLKMDNRSFQRPRVFSDRLSIHYTPHFWCIWWYRVFFLPYTNDSTLTFLKKACSITINNFYHVIKSPKMGDEVMKKVSPIIQCSVHLHKNVIWTLTLSCLGKQIDKCRIETRQVRAFINVAIAFSKLLLCDVTRCSQWIHLLLTYLNLI